MDDFEKLGAFYLGRPYDLATRAPQDGLILYDSKDLVTHAVCVGMTGSGKTGLCLALLEEAVVDGIPSLVIDPKGDLANLLLTFPNLEPEDFLPWINEEDARKKNLSPEDYAAQQAEFWKQGLASWGQDGARIKRLRDAAEFSIYTPGSNAGIPVSILDTFAAPPPAIREDTELMRERINTTVSSLLGLVGINADPIRSREHILLSHLLNTAWLAGKDLDLGALIQQLQSPPIARVGVMELESFFPAKDRFDLALTLNNLLAAPGFGAWLEGVPLEVQDLLYSREGKPCVAIFSIAHLNDAERMFFVSLLLNQTLGWMRTQSGTTSLRAILYMDEIFGYFPPVANPPSKLPLLSLLKQGRAFGLGVVLATQNPVDLDYKGLSNTGTWFIGRLQTERDKARVIEGLEGIAAGSGQNFERRQMEQILAGLGNRIFLLNNVHDDAPVIFESRWAMSYLRGPLTRNQIKMLMKPREGSVTASPRHDAQSPTMAVNLVGHKQQPVLPPEISQYFIPISISNPAGASVVYQPMILGAAEIRYKNSKQLDTSETFAVLAPFTDAPEPVDWDQAMTVDLTASDLETDPAAEPQFADLPPLAGKAKSYDAWRKDFGAWIYRNHRLELMKSSRLSQISTPGESERDFRIRMQHLAREQRDEMVEKLRQKFASKFAQCEERKRRAEQAVAREAEQARTQKVQTAISFGATLLSSFLGRKSLSASTLGRATTTARGVGRSMKEAGDVARAQDTVASVNQQMADLEEQFRRDVESIEQTFDVQHETLEALSLKPTKANITVKLLTLVWAPYWHSAAGNVPAY